MNTKKIISLFSILCIQVSIAMADPSSVGPNDQPAGEPIRVELLVVLALAAFVLFKLFGVGKTKAPPPPKPPKAKPLLKQVHEVIGDLQEVGDKTYVGGKLVSSKRDVETYLMMAQVDRSHIRKQERAMAQEHYQNYERRIFYFKLALGVLIILVLALTHETLIEWWNISYNYIKGLIGSMGSESTQ